MNTSAATPTVTPIIAGEERAVFLLALLNLRNAAEAGLPGQTIKANLRAIAAFDSMRSRMLSELLSRPRLDPALVERIRSTRDAEIARKFVIVRLEIADVDALLECVEVRRV